MQAEMEEGNVGENTEERESEQMPKLKSYFHNWGGGVQILQS